MKLFAGNSNPELFKEIADSLGKKLGEIELKKFSDGESIAVLKENVAGEKIVLLQSTCNPVNENLMELMIMASSALSNGAKEVHAIIPYYGYARQDRVANPGEPITTKLVVDLLKASGFASITTMDIHSPATKGFCKIEFNNITFFETLANYLKEIKTKEMLIVAPDTGALENSKKYSKELEVGLCYIKKKRSAAEKIESMQLEGNVKGKDVVMVDDMIGTGGTLIRAAELLKKEGANKIIVAATHGIFCGNALEKMEKSEIFQVIVSNTIPQERKMKKLKVLSVAKEFAEHIKKD